MPVNIPFDFDEWYRLTKEDPEEFELRRAAALSAVVANAPEALRPKLRGTLFKIEMTRRRAKNPLHAAILASELMWEAFYQMPALLNGLAVQTARLHSGEPSSLPKTDGLSAKIIPFEAPPEPRSR